MSTKHYLAKIRFQGLDVIPIAVTHTQSQGERWIVLYTHAEDAERHPARIARGEAKPASELGQLTEQTALLNSLIVDAVARSGQKSTL